MLRILSNVAIGGVPSLFYPGNIGKDLVQSRQAQLDEMRARTEHMDALTKQMSEMVTLPNGMSMPYGMAVKLYPAYIQAASREKVADKNIASREGLAYDRNAVIAARQGLKYDDQGNLVPMSREEMPPSLRSRMELNDAHENWLAARKELADAQASRDAQRIGIAQQRADTADENLKQRQREFEVATYGTDNGIAVPGGAKDAAGNPIGAKSPEARKQANGNYDLAANAEMIASQFAIPKYNTQEDALNALDQHMRAHPEIQKYWPAARKSLQSRKRY